MQDSPLKRREEQHSLIEKPKLPITEKNLDTLNKNAFVNI
jgi:hypothetical protein